MLLIVRGKDIHRQTGLLSRKQFREIPIPVSNRLTEGLHRAMLIDRTTDDRLRLPKFPAPAIRRVWIFPIPNPPITFTTRD